MEHLSKDYPTYNEMRGVYEEQRNALGAYNKPFSNTYNPGWRNHPNFSWRDYNQTQPSGGQWKTEQQPQPPKAYSVPQYNAQPPRSSLENTLQAFMEAQSKTNQKFEALFTQLVEERKEIKSQISKLTGVLAISAQERGKSPSQAQSIPKGQYMAQTSNSENHEIKEVNAIITCSGKSLDDPSTADATPVTQEVTFESTKLVRTDTIGQLVTQVSKQSQLENIIKASHTGRELIEENDIKDGVEKGVSIAIKKKFEELGLGKGLNVPSVVEPPTLELKPLHSQWAEQWAEKSEDALWAYRIAYKTPIEMSPHRMDFVRTNFGHLPVNLEHKAYWAEKSPNLNMTAVGEEMLLQLNDLEEFRTKAYREKTRKWHNKQILRRDFEPGQKFLLYNSRLRLFPRKLKFQGTGPFIATRTTPLKSIRDKANPTNFV